MKIERRIRGIIDNCINTARRFIFDSFYICETMCLCTASRDVFIIFNFLLFTRTVAKI